LFIVDSSGNRRALSDLGSSDQGQVLGVAPHKVAVFPGGMGEPAAIYVIDSINNSQNTAVIASGALFRIDPSNGNRTLVSDFNDQTKGPGDDPREITTTASGDLLVADDFLNTLAQPKLILIDHLSGERMITSDCSNTGQGLCSRPVGLTQLP